MSITSSRSSATDILCQSWHADSWDGHVILFKENGTGEITSRAELNVFLAAHFTWKFIKASDDPVSPSSTTQAFLDKILHPFTAPSQKILDASVEITLSDRHDALTLLVSEDADPSTWIGGQGLRPEAFQPRTLHLTVENGKFLPAKCEIKPSTPYALRMNFENSPYPSEEYWQIDSPAVNSGVARESHLSFVAKRL
ncbi:hypothetical protein BKA70DRAFT_1446844 [Coprinopsis sp. MPI-PUGE-AT-0042]|nr:hypothetical protein BKA70DRAFT_1446844 [Coprinopsis sp. MPI-PUGE-AT-0042]